MPKRSGSTCWFGMYTTSIWLGLVLGLVPLFGSRGVKKGAFLNLHATEEPKSPVSHALG